MSRISKDALLGASDLRKGEVVLDSLDGKPTVLVQGLGAGFSNQAQSEALEMTTTVRGEQVARVNTARMEEIQVLHGMVEPKFDTIEEARHFMENNGPAARKIVAKIDELSGVDKAAIEEAEAIFPSGSEAEAGEPERDAVAGGGDGPSEPVRDGSKATEVGA
jgi:hypothetical protein